MNCVGADVGLFYDETRAEEAKAICNGCKRRTACLEKALRSEEYGVWGGATPEERQAIRVRRNLEMDQQLYTAHEKCGTNAGYHRLLARRKKGEQIDDCAPCRLAHNEYVLRTKKRRQWKK